MKLRVWFIKPHVNFYVNIESEKYEYDLILVVKYFLFFFFSFDRLRAESILS